MSQKSEFEVERIVSDKYLVGKRFFFVKWKGFTSSDNTWEPEENLSGCPRLVREYFGGKGLRNTKTHNVSSTLLRGITVNRRFSQSRKSSIPSLASSPSASPRPSVDLKPLTINLKQANVNLKPQTVDTKPFTVELTHVKVDQDFQPNGECADVSISKTDESAAAAAAASAQTLTAADETATTSFTAQQDSGGNDDEDDDNDDDDDDGDDDDDYYQSGDHSTSIDKKPSKAKLTVRLFDRTPRPEVISSTPYRYRDAGANSDEELLSVKVFAEEEDSDKENTRSRRRRRRGRPAKRPSGRDYKKSTSSKRLKVNHSADDEASFSSSRRRPNITRSSSENAPPLPPPPSKDDLVVSDDGVALLVEQDENGRGSYFVMFFPRLNLVKRVPECVANKYYSQAVIGYYRRVVKPATKAARRSV